MRNGCVKQVTAGDLRTLLLSLESALNRQRGLTDTLVDTLRSIADAPDCLTRQDLIDFARKAVDAVEGTK